MSVSAALVLPMQAMTEPASSASRQRTQAAVYEAAFELLRMPPVAGHLAAVRSALEAAAKADPAGLDELRGAVASASGAEAEYARLISGASARIPAACPWHNCGLRDAAFAAADTLVSNDRFSELRVLSVLARRAGDALDAGKTEEAASIGATRKQFLAAHGLACVGDLAKQLSEGGTPLYGAVGRALSRALKAELSAPGPIA